MSNNVFVNDKLTLMSTQGDKATKRLEVFLRPTEKNEFFRFRLLWFKHDGSSRKVPYIERWIHQVWEDGEDGKRKLSEIACPISKHIAENWPGNPWDDCPICNFANMNFVAFKDSGYTDKAAATNSKMFKRKYDLIIPIYVVSDPCYSANVGKIRVFRISDKQIGESFKKMIVAKSSEEGTSIFNGAKGLDFLIRMDKVKHENKDGTSYTKNEIVQMGFTSRAYEIAAITPELIDAFPFDDYFGAIPTLQDLKEFHKKHCLHATTDDIDFDGLNDMQITTTSKVNESVEEKPANSNSNDEPLSDTDDAFDTDNLGLDLHSNEESISSDEMLNDLPDILKATDDADLGSLVEENNKAATAKKTSTQSSDVDIDDLLASVGFKD